MTKIKKGTNLSVVLLVVFTMLFSFTACDSDNDSKGTYSDEMGARTKSWTLSSRSKNVHERGKTEGG